MGQRLYNPVMMNTESALVSWLVGGTVPDELSGFSDEYRAAIESTLVTDASHLGSIEVSGTETQAFMHRMLTNDVASVSSGESTYATLLTPKGKMVSDCHLLHHGAQWTLLAETTRLDGVQQGLSRYVIAEDVTFNVPGAGLVPLADLSGPKGLALASELFELSDASSLKPGCLAIAPGTGSPFAGALVWRLRPSPRATTWGTDLRLRVLVPASRREAAASELVRALGRVGGLVGGRRVGETLRHEWATPRFGLDMDETHMPMEADLTDAVSFDKGCYVGQEYVVRLAHRGQLNKKLVALTLDCTDKQVPAPGSTVNSDAGEAIGTLTSSAYSPEARAGLAFGFVKRGYFTPQTELFVPVPESTITARLRPAP